MPQILQYEILASRQCRSASCGRLERALGEGRGGYLYVIDGRVDLNGDRLRTGDEAKVTGAAQLLLETDIAAELILIDVPLEFEPVGVWAGE